jgi:AraC-like DNA-binding protein
MEATLSERSKGGLERSCDGGRLAPGRIRFGTASAGIERLEAYFQGQAFAPHRHDTYAIGITLAGVQTFRYRGEQRHCLPGQCHILHPDETHDGGSGTDEGFGYRIAYIDPSLVQAALGGKPLPFVSNPVLDAPALPADFGPTVWDIDDDINDVARTEIVAVVADMLLAASKNAKRSGALCLASLSLVRDALAAQPAKRHSMAELERLAGLDRWTLARQFRAAFGTSPGRFRTMRQLDRVRRLLRGGSPLAEAAIDAGFADQSHMSRRFKSAYGLTPAKWVSAFV